MKHSWFLLVLSPREEETRVFHGFTNHNYPSLKKIVIIRLMQFTFRNPGKFGVSRRLQNALK